MASITIEGMRFHAFHGVHEAEHVLGTEYVVDITVRMDIRNAAATDDVVQTLDEVREADVLLHVVDISHPQYEEQLNVVNKTLAELGAADKPTITVFNKLDKYEEEAFDQWLDPEVKKEILDDLKQRWQNETAGHCVFVSATERSNIDGLRQSILNEVREMYRVRYPYKAEFFY